MEFISAASLSLSFSHPTTLIALSLPQLAAAGYPQYVDENLNEANENSLRSTFLAPAYGSENHPATATTTTTAATTITTTLATITTTIMMMTVDPLWTNMSVINCTGKKAITDLLTTKALLLSAYLAIFFTSICGNSLVVYVVATSKNMQTVTNIFITNLAISDLLVCCTSLWLTPVYTYVGHWVWGGWLCYGLPLFQGTSIFISTLTLMSIAVDRYFVICHHSKSIVNINERMSMQVCIAIITLIWMVSLLLVMPYAVHMRMAYVQQPCDFWLCVEDWAMEDLKSLYGVIVLSLQFLVPFAIIGHSYVRIWRFLNARRRKSRRSLAAGDGGYVYGGGSERESEAETQRKRRLLRMLVTMVVLFAICWFPFNLLNILRDLKIDAFLKPYFSFLFLVAHVISMTTTACNPVLYAWMNHAFRDEFVRVAPPLGAVYRYFVRRRGGGEAYIGAHGGRRATARNVKTEFVATAANMAKKCAQCRAKSLDGAVALINGAHHTSSSAEERAIGASSRCCKHHALHERKGTLMSLISGGGGMGRAALCRVASFNAARRVYRQPSGLADIERGALNAKNKNDATKESETNNNCAVDASVIELASEFDASLASTAQNEANSVPLANEKLTVQKNYGTKPDSAAEARRLRRASTLDTNALPTISSDVSPSTESDERATLLEQIYDATGANASDEQNSSSSEAASAAESSALSDQSAQKPKAEKVSFWRRRKEMRHSASTKQIEAASGGALNRRRFQVFRSFGFTQSLPR